MYSSQENVEKARRLIKQVRDQLFKEEGISLTLDHYNETTDGVFRLRDVYDYYLRLEEDSEGVLVYNVRPLYLKPLALFSDQKVVCTKRVVIPCNRKDAFQKVVSMLADRYATLRTKRASYTAEQAKKQALVDELVGKHPGLNIKVTDRGVSILDMSEETARTLLGA